MNRASINNVASRAFRVICLLALVGAAHAAKKGPEKKPAPPLPTDPSVILSNMTTNAYHTRERAVEAFKALPEDKQAAMIPDLVKLTAATDRLAWFGQSCACRALRHMEARAVSAAPGLQKSIVALMPTSDRPTISLLVKTVLAVDPNADKTLIPNLLSFLQGDDARAAQLALYALSSRGKSEAIDLATVEAVTALCRNTEADQRQRVRAIRTLSKLQAFSEKNVPTILDLAGDPDPTIQRTSVAALKSMGAAAKPALGALTKMADALNNKRRAHEATAMDISLQNAILDAIRHIQKAGAK